MLFVFFQQIHARLRRRKYIFLYGRFSSRFRFLNKKYQINLKKHPDFLSSLKSLLQFLFDYKLKKKFKNEFEGCVWPWKRERGMCPQILHECVRPRRKGKGRTLSEMKVGRNKRFGFNLVGRREGFPCAHWLKASRSARKDCDKSSVRKIITAFWWISVRFILSLKSLNLMFILFFSAGPVISSSKLDNKTEHKQTHNTD